MNKKRFNEPLKGILVWATAPQDLAPDLSTVEYLTSEIEFYKMQIKDYEDQIINCVNGLQRFESMMFSYLINIYIIILLIII